MCFILIIFTSFDGNIKRQNLLYSIIHASHLEHLIFGKNKVHFCSNSSNKFFIELLSMKTWIDITFNLTLGCGQSMYIHNNNKTTSTFSNGRMYERFFLWRKWCVTLHVCHTICIYICISFYEYIEYRSPQINRSFVFCVYSMLCHHRIFVSWYDYYECQKCIRKLNCGLW